MFNKEFLLFEDNNICKVTLEGFPILLPGASNSVLYIKKGKTLQEYGISFDYQPETGYYHFLGLSTKRSHYGYKIGSDNSIAIFEDTPIMEDIILKPNSNLYPIYKKGEKISCDVSFTFSSANDRHGYYGGDYVGASGRGSATFTNLNNLDGVSHFECIGGYFYFGLFSKKKFYYHTNIKISPTVRLSSGHSFPQLSLKEGLNMKQNLTYTTVDIGSKNVSITSGTRYKISAIVGE